MKKELTFWRRDKKSKNFGLFSRQYSKQSQLLFWDLYNFMSRTLQDKTYFAELNHEFTLLYNNSYFKYDFVNTISKRCIEFNGWNFHP